ncbi:RDD family protein [Streptomyces celluloflavus]|uniref:RDD family protein n=1 Tax=Streptomyces celluloflavus TaxID=58344 RepID=UPI00365F92EA
MSAPTSGSAGSPTPGFYPDPSIPGYIRYWNGAAWVPGTSRPAPAEGEAMPAPPPGVTSASPAPAPVTPAVEETGPVFLDEAAPGGAAVPVVRRSGEAETRPAAWDEPGRPHGTGPQAAASWQADASRQSGFGGEPDRRISWGPPEAPAARGGVPPQREESGGGAPAPAESAGGEPPAAAPPATPAPQDPDVPRDGTVTIRAVNPAAHTGRPASGDQGTTAFRTPHQEAAGPAKGGGTMAFRTAPPGGPDRPGAQPGPQTGRQLGQPSGPPGAAPQPLPSVGTPQQGRPPQPAQPRQQPSPGHPAQQAPPPQAPPRQQVPPQIPAPQPSAQQPAAPLPPARPHPGRQVPGQVPAQVPHGGPAAPAGQDAGADGVIPWKPPAADVFFAAAQAAQGHPAGLGRRFAARLIDSVVLGAAAAAVAVPMWGTAADHIDAKVQAAKQSGRQVTVYLLDGTTAPVLAAVLAVLLIGGGLYEALPTAKWGRTLGKKLCRVRVLDIESHDTPPLAAAVKRWLVYGVLGILVIGVVNALWCLFDRPWRQCWHDKAARTFVAAG